MCDNFSHLMNFNAEKTSRNPLSFLIESVFYFRKQYKAPKNHFFALKAFAAG